MPQTHTKNAQRDALRKQLRAQRNSLSAEQQRTAAAAICQLLSQQPVFKQAKHIAFYLANDGEIDPSLLVEEAQAQGKAVYLPVIDASSKQMVFQQVMDTTQWQKNRYGIKQPKANPEQQKPVQALDILCIPLVGFDRSGARLGMGGGFYDRALAPLKAQAVSSTRLIGLAHSCQESQCIPVQPWDIPLHAIVTEQAFITLI